MDLDDSLLDLAMQLPRLIIFRVKKATYFSFGACQAAITRTIFSTGLLFVLASNAKQHVTRALRQQLFR